MLLSEHGFEPILTLVETGDRCFLIRIPLLQVATYLYSVFLNDVFYSRAARASSQAQQLIADDDDDENPDPRNKRDFFLVSPLFGLSQSQFTASKVVRTSHAY